MILLRINGFKDVFSELLSYEGYFRKAEYEKEVVLPQC